MIAPASPRVWHRFSLRLARLLLGGVLVVSGVSKALALPATIASVRAFQLLPWPLPELVGISLPFIEILLGVWLISGRATRVAGAMAAGLMVIFIAGIVSVWTRGIAIDCGCFGGGGQLSELNVRSYVIDIARDLGLGALGLGLALLDRRPDGAKRLLEPVVGG